MWELVTGRSGNLRDFMDTRNVNSPSEFFPVENGIEFCTYVPILAKILRVLVFKTRHNVKGPGGSSIDSLGECMGALLKFTFFYLLTFRGAGLLQLYDSNVYNYTYRGLHAG